MRITDDGKQRVSDRAAEWVLILDADPSPRNESGFRAWLTESPEHTRQFLLASAAFHEFERVEAIRGQLIKAFELETLADSPAVPDNPPAATFRSAARTHMRPALLGAAALAIVAALLLLRPQQKPTTLAGIYSEPGQFSLGNASFMRLSHDPRAVVHPLEGQHGVQVILLRGAAEFWGTHPAENQLQVFAGHTFIDALGTDFDVRRDASITVTAVKEGKVRLRPYCKTTSDLNSDRSIIPRGAQLREIVLGPGQSVEIRDEECDEPSEDNGETVPSSQSNASAGPEWLSFDEVSVKDAITAFNRWNATRLVVSDSVLANRRIGGRFRTSDVESFVAVLRKKWGAKATRTKGVNGTLTITLVGSREN